MKSKLFIPIFTLFLFSVSTIKSQTFDEKYNLTICTMTRNASATLTITYGSGNTFTGILNIDGQDRQVYGWDVVKKSEGAGYIYNTESLVFYVKINGDFQHQQLFKGIFNYDKTILSGEYFYAGNEFIFQGVKIENITSLRTEVIEETVKLYPSPVEDILNIKVLNINYNSIEIFDLKGIKLKEDGNVNQISVNELKAGTYILKLIGNSNSTTSYKFIKK